MSPQYQAPHAIPVADDAGRRRGRPAATRIAVPLSSDAARRERSRRVEAVRATLARARALYERRG